MSYCRFQNTLRDMNDCYDHLNNLDTLEGEEKRAALAMIKLCKAIASDFENE
jgi:hypothetical protein